ncbi:hypothetical protein FPV67DRAFT_1669306 [Lyophyllum atratum]|nr:hypothetical protein FPV67DRAFT_1669306 [Lyophyllum atratum]
MVRAERLVLYGHAIIMIDDEDGRWNCGGLDSPARLLGSFSCCWISRGRLLAGGSSCSIIVFRWDVVRWSEDVRVDMGEVVEYGGDRVAEILGTNMCIPGPIPGSIQFLIDNSVCTSTHPLDSIALRPLGTFRLFNGFRSLRDGPITAPNLFFLKQVAPITAHGPEPQRLSALAINATAQVLPNPYPSRPPRASPKSTSAPSAREPRHCGRTSPEPHFYLSPFLLYEAEYCIKYHELACTQIQH